MLIFPIVNFVEKTINVEKVIVLHMAKRARSAMEKITFKLNVAVLIIALSNPKKLFRMINHLQMMMYISTILHTFQIEALQLCSKSTVAKLVFNWILVLMSISFVNDM